MKVCTDACLFGAWLAHTIFQDKLCNKKILDIGCGTGLLSLLIAQKNNESFIDAVEIDASAYKQASENFAQSPWHQRLQCFNTPIQSFFTDKTYDIIISNPPFFEHDLKSDDSKRNAALHSSELTLHELLIAVKTHLATEGYFAVLLPFNRTDYFENLAESEGFFVQKKLLVKQTDQHPFFRSMILFAKHKTDAVETEIVIKNEGIYSTEFIQLLQDYYLYL